MKMSKETLFRTILNSGVTKMVMGLVKIHSVIGTVVQKSRVPCLASPARVARCRSVTRMETILLMRTICAQILLKERASIPMAVRRHNWIPIKIL